MVRWYFIAIGVFLFFMGASIMTAEYQKGQCRIEAIKIGKSAEEIAQICR
jgi:hypothetical protein